MQYEARDIEKRKHFNLDRKGTVNLTLWNKIYRYQAIKA
jgi:hypothetical protein